MLTGRIQKAEKPGPEIKMVMVVVRTARVSRVKAGKKQSPSFSKPCVGVFSNEVKHILIHAGFQGFQLGSTLKTGPETGTEKSESLQ